MVLAVKNLPARAGDIRDANSVPWVRKVPWRRAWPPTPVFLPRESQGRRSLAGYIPRGCKELHMTKGTYTHTHTHGKFGRENRLVFVSDGFHFSQ